MSYTRKIQKIGESFFVSLPKSWIERNSLSRGDIVTLVEKSDGTISLYGESKKREPKEITLIVEKDEPIRSLRRRLTGAYVDGFDLIYLKAETGFSDEQQDAIREITEGLFGLEIVELSSHQIIIQCLLTRSIPIERMINGIHNTIKSMFSETISALEEREPAKAQGVIRRTRYVKRLSLMVHRLLRSLIAFPEEGVGEIKPIDGVDFLRVVERITEISGAVKRISESVVKWKNHSGDFLREKLIALCSKVLRLYDESIHALMYKDIRLANHVIDEKMEIEFANLWDRLMKAEQEPLISASAFPFLHRIIDNLERISIYTVEIAEIAIDHAEETSQK
ncbi:phosphate uptake regulator PhoU [Candidatus Bathyarchaeota archaeon]|nr:phosphate uptake regulator PhoU [Candidatus Bathyarchaeota archaeon]